MVNMKVNEYEIDCEYEQECKYEFVCKLNS